MPTLLRAMTAAEFEIWSDRQHEGYVQQMAELGGMDPSAARGKAVADRARLLPDGFATPGHRFWVAEAGGHQVGSVWISAVGGSGWVYDIEVAQAVRGRGHGRAMMVAAEGRAREMGVDRLGLNVFAGNAAAIRLYESLGYVVTERRPEGQNMTKAL